MPGYPGAHFRQLADRAEGETSRQLTLSLSEVKMQKNFTKNAIRL